MSRTLILACVLIATGCTSLAPQRCERNQIANSCYWLRGGVPNGAGNGNSGQGANGGYGAKSATSGGAVGGASGRGR